VGSEEQNQAVKSYTTTYDPPNTSRQAQH